jgi:hypothetical protein
MNIYSCEEIQDALIDYINRRLSQSERSRVVLHFSGCKNCKEEVAYLIKIRQSCNAKTADVPAEIALSAFDKIPDRKSKYGLKYYLDPVYDSFRLITQTLRLSRQIL